MEPDYTEALLALHDRDFEKAHRLLDRVLQVEPAQIEARELRALVFKGQDKKPEAAATYRELIASGLKAGRAPDELAPYRFDLGMIEYGQGHRAEAKAQFAEVAQTRINQGPARYFLGMIEFADGKDAEAEEQFELARRSSVPELGPTAQYFTGLLFLRAGQAGLATQSFYRARRDALRLVAAGSASMKDIVSATDQALKPMDRSSFFGSVTLMAGYDTNVLAVPDSTPENSATGKKSVTQNLSVSTGYMSSPVRDWQLVPSYRISIPYHDNRDARSAEFVSQHLGAYVNREPLAAVNYGVKLGANHTFQNVTVGENRGVKYEPYSLSGELGAFFRYAPSARRTVGAELEWDPIRNYTDPTTTAANRRSGSSSSLRVYLQEDGRSPWWSPTYAATLKVNAVSGRDQSLISYGISLSNPMKLPGSAGSLSASVDLSSLDYDDRTTYPRQDTMLNLSLAWSRGLTDRLTGLASVTHTRNASGPGDTARDLYQYSRWSFQLGASCSLF